MNIKNLEKQLHIEQQRAQIIELMTLIAGRGKEQNI